MKFGGTSLSTGSNIKRVTEIIKRYRGENEVAVVCSAMDDVTDRLLETIQRAEAGRLREAEEELERLEKLHLGAVDEAVSDPETRRGVLESIKQSLTELRNAVIAIYYLREATPRSQDYVLSFGERMSSRIVAGALESAGVRAAYLEGGEAGILTDSNFGEATPIMDVTRLEVKRRVGSLLDEGVTPVITGFIARNEEGVITTLGRGGSDYTATIVAYAVEADEVWLWSDVDGLMTADPRIVPNAMVLPHISFEEAIEMALFGAKGLHPRALEPARQAGIKVRIKNTFNPEAPGTLISEERSRIGGVVKCVLLVRNVGMLTIRGASMVGRVGTSARILDAIARCGVNVMMISQSVSESSISLIVTRSKLSRALKELENELRGSELVGQIESEDDVSVVAVVGDGMKGTPGVASKVFTAVAKRSVNVRMIAQGSSELNISFVVKERDAVEAVRAIHEEYELHKVGRGIHEIY